MRLSLAPSRPWAFVALFALAPSALAQHVVSQERTSLGIDDAEITPDGRFAVLRENTFSTTARVVDLATGQLVATHESSLGDVSGVCFDGVRVTDERAIVLGTQVQFIDLSLPGAPRIAERYAGNRPRDVALSADGRFAVVRGGSGTNAGSYIYEMATGNELLYSPGETTFNSGPYEVDCAAATMDHGVTTSVENPGAGAETRVTVFELDPAGGGGPRVVYDAAPLDWQPGKPMDLVVSPDGLHAAVRSDLGLSLYRLDGVNTAKVWDQALVVPPVPYGDSVYDAVLMTDDLVATISRGDPAIASSFLDVYDLAGQHWFALLQGFAHDMCLTPDGTKLLVRTSSLVYQFDLANLPAAGQLSVSNAAPHPASANGLFAGLDSIVCSDKLAVAVAPRSAGARVRAYDITSGTPVLRYTALAPLDPVDVDLTPDGTRAVVVGKQHYQVIDLRTFELVLDEPVLVPGAWPWCDGAAVNDQHAVCFGVGDYNSTLGWSDVVDLFGEPVRFCRSGVNSTGEIADLFALGSQRVSANDLSLRVIDVTPNVPGFLAYGTLSGFVAFGGGFTCVSGQVARLPVVQSGADGIVRYDIDYGALPSSGATITAGLATYWQFFYRDLFGPGSFNSSNGLRVDFVN